MAGGRPGDDGDRPDGRLQRRPGRARSAPPPRRRLPVRVRGGQRRRARGDLAVRAHRTGHGHRRRARVPRLHLGSRRGACRVGPAVLRSARLRRTQPCTRATTSGSPPGSRSGRGWRSAPGPSGSPIVATGGRPPRTRSRRCSRRSSDPPATASSSTSGCLPMASRWSSTTRPSNASTGRPERVDALTARLLEDVGVPALADVMVAIGRRPFLDVELKVDAGRAAVEILAAGRGPGLERAAVSSFDRGTLEGIARLAPTWRRWLNSHTLDAATIADAVSLGCSGVAVEWRALDRGSVRRATAAGLEVVSWTVRRRPTFDRLARARAWSRCASKGALLDRVGRGAGRHARRRLGRAYPSAVGERRTAWRIGRTWWSSGRGRSAAGRRSSRDRRDSSAWWSSSAGSPAWAPRHGPPASSAPRAARRRRSRSGAGPWRSTRASAPPTAPIPGFAGSATSSSP